jgi:hypothetical protein
MDEQELHPKYYKTVLRFIANHMSHELRPNQFDAYLCEQYDIAVRNNNQAFMIACLELKIPESTYPLLTPSGEVKHLTWDEVKGAFLAHVLENFYETHKTLTLLDDFIVELYACVNRMPLPARLHGLCKVMLLAPNLGPELTESVLNAAYDEISRLLDTKYKFCTREKQKAWRSTMAEEAFGMSLPLVPEEFYPGGVAPIHGEYRSKEDYLKTTWDFLEYLLVTSKCHKQVDQIVCFLMHNDIHLRMVWGLSSLYNIYSLDVVAVEKLRFVPTYVDFFKQVVRSASHFVNIPQSEFHKYGYVAPPPGVEIAPFDKTYTFSASRRVPGGPIADLLRSFLDSPPTKPYLLNEHWLWVMRDALSRQLAREY